MIVAAAAPDPLQHGWWLASRAAGAVALLLVTASTVLGLAMALRPAWARRHAPRLVTLHEQLSLSALGAIAVHGVTLLGDRWLRPGLAGIALPGAMSYRPLFTSLGVVAGWLLAVLGLSYYARGRIGVRRWRALHRLVLLAYALAVVHTLGAGTDAVSAWLRVPLLASIPLVLGLFALRVVRRDPPNRKGIPPMSPRPARPARRARAETAR